MSILAGNKKLSSKTKFLYFHDPNGDHKNEIFVIKSRLEEVLGFEPKVQHTDFPPFQGSRLEQDFDILFFDYGGIGMIGNSLFDDMTRMVLRDAEDHPSKIYIVTSMFTWDYMEEARTEFEGKLHNVFTGFKTTLGAGMPLEKVAAFLVG